MSRIDSTAQIVSLMRTQFGLARRAQDSSTLSSGKTKATDIKKKSLANAEPLTSQARHLIAQVAAISLNDPQRHEKAFRLFMASVLAQEFGVGLRGNGELEQLLDQVIQKMQGDPHLRMAMHEAAENLLTGISPTH